MALVSGMDYCAYSHHAAMLERTGLDWLIAVYETYLDDSGTNAQSEIAIAACYVSTEPGWRNFVKEWNAASTEEGFEKFHMAEFVAKNDQGHKPWCEWDVAKKTRVYKRLATIINENKRIGVACAIPKAVYDAVPLRIRKHWGMEHYTYAVRMCLMRIAEWRAKSLISQPMQYVFDWEDSWTPKYKEISGLMGGVHEKLKPMFGLDSGGFMFQRKQVYKPLQAADILAWQMNNHMRKIYPNGENEENLPKVLHEGFRQLRQDQEMDLGFFTETNMQAWITKIEAFEAENGVLYPDETESV
jgi:hypothetical protein